MKMRGAMARIGATLLAIGLAALSGCRDATRTISRTIALDRGAGVKVFAPPGRVHLVGWDRDSLRVEGKLGAGEAYFFQGDARGVKFGVDLNAPPGHASPSEFTVYVPRSSSIAIKGATTDIEATDVSGYFYTVSGHLRLGGTVREAQLESVSGAIEVHAAAPWLRVRSADGAVSVRGDVEDVAVATVTGDITLAPRAPARVRIETMDGRVSCGGGLASQGIIDIDTHAGAVELRFDATVSARLEVETVQGAWADEAGPFARVMPLPEGRRYAGTLGTRTTSLARVRVTTFSGGVRLLPPDIGERR